MFRNIESSYLNYTKKLSEAARKKKPLEIIKKIVEAKANVNYPSEQPPLYVLINTNHDIPRIKYLLEQKANINWKRRDSRKDGLLHLSVYHGLIGVIKILLENKADPNSVNNHGDTPLHIATHGYNENDEKIVNVLLEYNASPSITNKENHTPLLSLKQSINNRGLLKREPRKSRAIMFLLSEEGMKYREEMKEYTEKLSASELTPLTQQFFVMILGFPDDIILNVLFPYLLPSAPKHPIPDILIPDELHPLEAKLFSLLKDIEFFTTSEWYLNKQIKEITDTVQTMKECKGLYQPSINRVKLEKNCYEKTPLSLLYERSHNLMNFNALERHFRIALELFDFFIKNGADVHFDDESMLMSSARCNNVKYLETLILAGAKVNHKSYGETAVMIAAGNNYKQSVELLVEKKADLQLVNNHNKTAADIALENKHTHMHRFLTSLTQKENHDKQEELTDNCGIPSTYRTEIF